jgi:hypothetical protein
MSEHDQDQDRDHGSKHDDIRDPGREQGTSGGKTVAPVSMASMLASTSLTQLASVFNQVDTSAHRGQTGLPMLLFRAKEPEPWGIGQKRLIPAEGGRWFVDLATFMWGYICFPARDKA